MNGTVAKAKKELKMNRLIVIFPEGAGRWCDIGQLENKKPGRGAAVIALSTGAPIIPVGIFGTDMVFPPYSFKMNPIHTIKVKIGKPLTFEVIYQEGISETLLETTMQQIMQRIKENITSEIIGKL